MRSLLHNAPAAPAAPVAYAPFAPVAPVASTAPAAPAVTLDAVDVPQPSVGNLEAENEWVLEPPVSLQKPAESASAAPYHLELPEQPAARTGTPGISVEDLVAAADADAAAAERARNAGAASAAATWVDTSVGDDFTRIVGLGKSSERKLKGTGITTYAELAAVPVEMVASILGVPVEEVIEDEVQKQAHNLAR